MTFFFSDEQSALSGALLRARIEGYPDNYFSYCPEKINYLYLIEMLLQVYSNE